MGKMGEMVHTATELRELEQKNGSSRAGGRRLGEDCTFPPQAPHCA